MGLHVCRRTFAGGMRCEDVSAEDWREAHERDTMTWREWFRRIGRGRR